MGKHRHPDSSLISLSFQKLGEAQVEGWGFRAGGVVRGLGCESLSALRQGSLSSILAAVPVSHKVKSFPGFPWCRMVDGKGKWELRHV